MRKQTIILLLLLTTYAVTRGQAVFEKSYAVDINAEKNYISNLVQLPDSGFVFSVVSYHNQNNSILLGRIDKEGETSWIRQLDEPYTLRQANFDISPTGFIHLTYTALKDNPTEFFPVVVKLDLDGNIIWSKGFPVNTSRSAHAEQIFIGDNCIYIAGEVNSPAPSNLFLMKTDTVGNLIWGITYSTGGTDYLRDATILSNGDMLLSGMSEDAQFNNYGCLVRISSDGNLIWKKRFHSSLFKLINMQAITEHPDGNILLSGHADSISQEIAFGLWDMCLIKVSSNGDFQWGKIYGGEDYDEFWEVIPTDDGGYMLAAEPESFGNVSRIGLMKVDDTGELEWLKLYGQNSGGFPNSLVKTLDNGFAILGMNGSYDEIRTMLMLKTDSLGNSYCQNTTATLPSMSISSSWENYGNIGSFLGSGNYSPTVIDYPLTASDYCKPSDVTVQFLENDFQLYPNPTSGFLTVKFPNRKEVEAILHVRDIQGRIRFSKNLKSINNQAISFDLTEFKSGVYILEVIADDQQFRQKILKK